MNRAGGGRGSAPTRRAVLAGAAVLPLALAACGRADGSSPAPAGPDALQPLADAARADTALLTAAAALGGEHSAALTVVAGARRRHLQRLDEEIRRVAGGSSPGPADTAPYASSANAAPTMDQVRTAIAASADRAAQAAQAQSGYRAALCGAVAASCGAAAEVLK